MGHGPGNGGVSGVAKAGVCLEPGCGALILVSDRTGLIRRHTPRGVLMGKSWCPAGATIHPDWREHLGSAEKS